MPRTRPSKIEKSYNKALNQANENGLEATDFPDHKLEGIENLKSLLDCDELAKPSVSQASSTSSISSNTVALHGELNIFRQRWKRELESKKNGSSPLGSTDGDNVKHASNETHDYLVSQSKETVSENKIKSNYATFKQSFTALNDPPKDPEDIYNLAKKLFLIGVDLERDELHNESIRYYKQAMHLCPNIEKQIFREQLNASRSSQVSNIHDENSAQRLASKHDDSEKESILVRIKTNLIASSQDGKFTLCRPAHKVKFGSLHISQLPQDLILKICHYLIGQELDLMSLEQFGMVCRGFYIISRDSSVWRSICCRIWDVSSLSAQNRTTKEIDWRRLFIEKPRVNFDGIYISRTRYIRQGDTGFQDITYRPFHLIRYYRYMRFFACRRVLILTTNEEPERIIPIFRHAFSSKHFSPELAVLEGTYEFIEPNQVVVAAEKEFLNQDANVKYMDSRRNSRFHWSRQTPLNQKFNMKFELKTNENRPYKNNLLKWCEYTISSKFETGTEVTNFDLSPDTFPNLMFSRVKRFNQHPIEHSIEN